MITLLHFLLFVELTYSVSDGVFNNYLNISLRNNMLEMFVPTLVSENIRCKNHTLYYLEELEKMAIWATEMFDASGKFPSGFLYGSLHNLGNFDECLDIKVPYEENDAFVGQYCLTKMTITPPNKMNIIHPSNFYTTNNYVNFFNQSVWEKMRVYSEDKTKGPRNELYTALCLPSSCLFDDLQHILQEKAKKYGEQNEFQLLVDINKRDCQTTQPLILTSSDMGFIYFLIFSLLIMFLSTIYDIMVGRYQYKHIELKGKLHRIILCFSFSQNYGKLIKTQEGNELNCLAGMKVLSMLAVIMLHRIMFDFGSPIMNPEYVENLYTKFETIILLNGPILVETFFTISGFLATYLILQQLKINKNSNLLFFYTHRYIRVTPPYAVIIAFYCTLFIKIGSGPLWQQKLGVEQERCISSWWANLLYINNYVNTDKICMFQSWFITCDMNFYIFSPLLAWFLFRKPKLGLVILVLLIITSIAAVFAKVYIDKLDAMYMIYLKLLRDPVVHKTFKVLYIPGHMRASSYFIGSLFGYIKFKMNETNYKLSSNIVKIGWIISFPVIILSLAGGYFFYLYEIPQIITALYACVYHPLWSIGIAWIIIALSSGYGPLVNSILSWRPFIILARLSFCVYISHGIIQMYIVGSTRTPLHINVTNLIYKTAADIFLGYILAFILCMLYESPIIALEKVLLEKNPINRE